MKYCWKYIALFTKFSANATEGFCDVFLPGLQQNLPGPPKILRAARRKTLYSSCSLCVTGCALGIYACTS